MATVTLRGGPCDGKTLDLRSPETCFLRVPIIINEGELDPELVEFGEGLYCAANGWRFVFLDNAGEA